MWEAVDGAGEAGEFEWDDEIGIYGGESCEDAWEEHGDVSCGSVMV